MPEVLSPPSSPGVRIANPLPPPKPPPAPTREIKLGAPSDPGPGHVPPKPGSARSRLSDSLARKAGVTPAPSAEEAEPEIPPAPAPEVPDPGEAPEVPPVAPDPSVPPVPPPAPAPKGKVNPWKLVEEYKGKIATLEKQVSEAKTVSLPAREKDEYLGQIKTLSERNKQLEDEMRFVNYEQSQEFKDTYQVPYEKAFQSAVEEMSELVIEDPNTGARRQVNSQDILSLCNLGLAEARQKATELYGDFADDMMAHRKEIRSLFSKRQQALKDAKENGAQRVKQQSELAQKTFKEVNDRIKSTWESANQSAVKDEKYGKYFAAVEGDQDGNQRLAKGFELVDRAFSENPQDPLLTAEQRDSVVKRHSAVRHRAAGFGRLRSWYEAAVAENASLKKELEQYKGSEPPTGGAPPAEVPAGQNGTAWNRTTGALRKLAR